MRRLLVVDDSEVIRQVIADAFRPAGYVVETAGNGSIALGLIAERAPDLVISDVLMPVMDGWALCEEIRRHGHTREIPFIFLTSESDVPKRIKGLELGADDYVCKPFSKEELVARAEAVLRRYRPGLVREPPERGPVLSGTTDHIAIADLLQMLSMNSKSGTLHLRGRSIARIYFRQGQIINAETQGLRGEKALFRIMAWPEARYEFEPGEAAREIEAALDGSTSTVLMEGFAQLDELRDLIASLPGDEVVLAVSSGRDPDRGAARLTTTQRLILLTAGGGGARLGRIIDTLPENDLAAYTAIDQLLRDGWIHVVEKMASS